MKWLVILHFIAGCYRPSDKGSLTWIFYFLSEGLLFTLNKDVKFWKSLLTCWRNHLPALIPHMKRPIRIISKDRAVLLQPMIDAATIMSRLLQRRHFFLQVQESKKHFCKSEGKWQLSFLHVGCLGWSCLAGFVKLYICGPGQNEPFHTTGTGHPGLRMCLGTQLDLGVWEYFWAL